ncbi:LysR family transcriptional regulator [Martelella soudanensis]|uniref:LysR family transcriptional regulator n=1 Tax=unclassified Martelella TaxID=2629616 RepID=UPI0015E0213D|nr:MULTISPECIES: LysR family transcriptional regulator [unclassified Martelella]
MAGSAVLSRLPNLRHFVEVACGGSFRAAANKMNIAPSAVSKQIKNLEETLGVGLFIRDRDRVGLELTEAGEILLRRCTSVINELVVAREELQELHGIQRGHLRLGVNEVLATDLLPGVLDSLHRNYPNLKYTIMVENTPDMLARLREGDIEVGLGYNIPFAEEFEILATLERRTYLITPNNHPLAKRRHVKLEEVAGEKFIFPNPSLTLHQMLHDAFIRSGVDVRPSMTTNSFALLRQMVENGMGVSMVIGRFLQRKTEQITFIEITDVAIDRKPLSCCRIAGRTPSTSSLAFNGGIKALFLRCMADNPVSTRIQW